MSEQTGAFTGLTDPAELAEQVLALLRQGRDLATIASDLAPDDERRLLRRCAAVRLFDRDLLDRVLRKIPDPIGPEAVPFERLTASPAVEPVPGSPGAFRVAAKDRLTYLEEWAAQVGAAAVLRTRQELVAYFEAKGKALDESLRDGPGGAEGSPRGRQRRQDRLAGAAHPRARGQHPGVALPPPLG